MAQATLSVTGLLLIAIVLNGSGVLFPILLPVIGIADTPFARTVPAYLAVFGIGGDLRFVIFGAPPPLALRSAAYRLVRLELRWLEAPLAYAATPFVHRDVVALDPADGIVSRFRNCCRVLTASPPMGPTTLPGELRLF